MQLNIGLEALQQNRNIKWSESPCNQMHLILIETGSKTHALPYKNVIRQIGLIICVSAVNQYLCSKAGDRRQVEKSRCISGCVVVLQLRHASRMGLVPLKFVSIKRDIDLIFLVP